MKSSGILVGILVLLFVLLAISSAVSAEEVTLTFQQGDGGAYSNTLGANVGGLFGGHDGSGQILHAHSVADLLIEYSYISFPDIIGTNPGQIPPGSAVEVANLTFTHVKAGTHETSLIQVTSSWEESTVDYATRPTTSGVVGTIPAGSGTQVAGILSVMQAWVHGTATNYGLELWPGWSQSSIDEAFYSDDGPIPALRPRLTVTFIPPLAPVEPSTWGKVKALYR